MIFFAEHNQSNNFEEEEAGVDDALIGELDDELDDEDEEVFDPLLKGGVDDELGVEEAEEGEATDDDAKVFDDDEDEEDMDYDSFDDEDEL